MEVEVAQDKLAKALGLVSKVAVGARSTLPVLSNVLIKSEGGKVSLTATDLDMAIVDYVPVIKATDGAVTVPARLLAEFVTNLPSKETIKIKADGVKVKISAGKFSSVINGVVADDFPELPGINEENVVSFKMPVDEFKEKVAKVLVSVSSDTTRPALTGVCFDTKDGAMYLASTDAYRAVVEKFIESVESEMRVLVPAASLSEVIRSITDDMDEVEMLFDESQARFRLGEVEITSKIIDAAFPDYWAILPKSADLSMTVEKSELAQTTKIASIFARQANRAICLNTDVTGETLKVASILNELGENASEIKISNITGNDASMKIDAKYLLDALNTVSSSDVILNYTEASRQLILKDTQNEDFWHLVMLIMV